MKDSVDDARKELCDAIRSGIKSDFQKVVERLKACAETGLEEKRIEESGGYIFSNRTVAKIRLEDRKTVKGCSTKAHVSHALSSWMSSRPMGWSRTGADKMTHLRAHYWNGGNMLELAGNRSGNFRQRQRRKIK